MENIVKIWFVGNNDTEHPDMELKNCEVKRYNGGMGIIQTTDGKIVDMFVPYHNLNALSWIKEIESDEDST
jgi:hypothetical protein